MNELTHIGMDEQTLSLVRHYAKSFTTQDRGGREYYCPHFTDENRSLERLSHLKRWPV